MKDASLTLSSGLRLCYAEFGDPEGVPTFYFHGWPCSRLHAWTMHEAALKQGIRLICPDRPGLGLSDDHPERQLLDWPPVVEELANHLGWEKFHIIGVSGGGPYALVCAARGCPPLRTEAFVGARLDAQLEEQGRIFLGQIEKNRVDSSKRILFLSPIFKWFSGDFEATSGTVTKFVTPFFPESARTALATAGADFKIDYTDYDWSLNDQAKK